MGRTRVNDDELDRQLSKDVEDNWAGILVDRIIELAGVVHAEIRHMAQRQPEARGHSTDLEPLIEGVKRDGRELKRILIEHGLIPVLSRRRGQH